MITALEVRRQIVHVVLGLLLAILLFHGIINAWIILLFSLVALFLSQRLKHGKKVPLQFFFDHLQRPSEMANMPAQGLFFYLLGSGIAAALYTKDIAIASILILAFGDSVSRLVGPYGYLKYPYNSRKFLEGIIAGAFAATIVASFFVGLSAALIASLFAMLLEGIDIKYKDIKIDDNLTIPIAAGFFMTLLIFL
ncbi:hypothetical protein H6504_03850 [Candidatus Woesearchaeota archaeon]|nr:hypothetical protein [Candidatus Woesearchaeota archaeon]